MEEETKGYQSFDDEVEEGDDDEEKNSRTCT